MEGRTEDLFAVTVGAYTTSLTTVVCGIRGCEGNRRLPVACQATATGGRSAPITRGFDKWATRS